MGRRETGFPPGVREIIDGRSRCRCEVQVLCKGARAVHKHHRRNRASGGTRRPDTNTAANALDACFNCHEYIGMHPAEAYEKGWLVRQSASPAAVPVLYRSSQWVLLSVAGDVQEVAAFARGDA